MQKTPILDVKIKSIFSLNLQYNRENPLKEHPLQRATSQSHRVLYRKILFLQLAFLADYLVRPGPVRRPLLSRWRRIKVDAIFG